VLVEDGGGGGGGEREREGLTSEVSFWTMEERFPRFLMYTKDENTRESSMAAEDRNWEKD